MPFYGEIDVNAQDPDSGKMGGGGGGGGSNLPGGGYGGWGGGGGGGGGGGAGGADPGSGGSLPIWDWMKKGGEKVGGAMGGVGMGMDAFNMAAAPQQQAMAEAKAGSQAAHQKNQAIAWQSPEYQMWAKQLWGG